MPVHALLGATGATGSAVLRYILTNPQPDLTLNIFVRSKDKLLAAFPKLEASASCKIRIFSAQLSDAEALSTCLKDASVIYNCISTNHSTRGVHVARSAAEAIINALTRLRTAHPADYRTPIVIINRTIVLNPAIPSNAPWLIAKIAEFALGYVFDDLRAACDMFSRAASANESPSLLSFVFVDAPGLMDQDGTERTGYELVQAGKISPMLSYADFGASFVEIGERREEFDGKGVAVSATGKVKATMGTNLGYLLAGLRARLLPF